MAAVTMSTEQFQTFMKQMLEHLGGGGPGAEGCKRTIFEKNFMRTDKFSKGENAWIDWAFDFKVALGAQSEEMRKVLDVVETQKDEMSVQKVTAMDGPHAERIHLRKLASELYEVLVMTTEGEAKLMVRAVESQDGVAAWHRLYRHYNRRALARVFRAHREVMHPKAVTDMNELIAAVMEWEDKWTKVERTKEAETARSRSRPFGRWRC